MVVEFIAKNIYWIWKKIKKYLQLNICKYTEHLTILNSLKYVNFHIRSKPKLGRITHHNTRQNQTKTAF